MSFANFIIFKLWRYIACQMCSLFGKTVSTAELSLTATAKNLGAAYQGWISVRFLSGLAIIAASQLEGCVWFSHCSDWNQTDIYLHRLTFKPVRFEIIALILPTPVQNVTAWVIGLQCRNPAGSLGAAHRGWRQSSDFISVWLFTSNRSKNKDTQETRNWCNQMPCLHLSSFDLLVVWHQAVTRGGSENKCLV